MRSIEEDIGREADGLRGHIVVGMPAPVANFTLEPLILSSLPRDHRNSLVRQAAEIVGELDVLRESTSLATTRRLIAGGLISRP